MLRSQIETMSASWTEPSSSLKGGKKVSAALTENHDERSPSADLICRPVLVRLWTVPARVPATCTDATLPEGFQAVICMVVTESRPKPEAASVAVTGSVQLANRLNGSSDHGSLTDWGEGRRGVWASPG